MYLLPFADIENAVKKLHHSSTSHTIGLYWPVIVHKENHFIKVFSKVCLQLGFHLMSLFRVHLCVPRFDEDVGLYFVHLLIPNIYCNHSLKKKNACQVCIRTWTKACFGSLLLRYRNRASGFEWMEIWQQSGCLPWKSWDDGCMQTPCLQITFHTFIKTNVNHFITISAPIRCRRQPPPSNKCSWNSDIGAAWLAKGSVKEWTCSVHPWLQKFRGDSDFLSQFKRLWAIVLPQSIGQNPHTTMYEMYTSYRYAHLH